MRRPLLLGDEIFPTKAAARSRVQEFLHGSRYGEPLNERDDLLCRALLERHRHGTQKIGVGIAHFEVRAGPYGGPSLWLVRLDGSETDWSYLECLHPSDQRDDVLVAFREAVFPQVQAFKNASFEGRISVPCAVTGELVTAADCHIDHAPPIFLNLAEQFVESLGGWDAVRVTPTTDGLIGCRLVDAAQERAWCAFHRREARLRVTTRIANLSLLRRKS